MDYKMLPGKLKYILASSFKLDFLYSSPYYSQEGEDIILGNIFDVKKSGFYIDVGAYHPYKFSNTYLLYKRGWRGINIEPRPGSKALFSKLRPRDINIEAAIANTNKDTIYYMFDESALNTFSRYHFKAVTSSNQSRYKHSLRIKTKKLKDILKSKLPKNTTIDLLNIDAEGSELEILKSNDWSLYSPKIICIEILNTPKTTKIYAYLKRLGYKLIAQTLNTKIFEKNT